ncbi:hypothetical protein [Gelidibacter salicanalis]|uniref:DUF4625 domain-containing protein n=1 Tax=Gelidibacter salicanalis TaxID=291193 RepID=A0A934KWD3_9FLAO|nr:hypothetical protein [Gelidibacter salicanalis]MBJ7881528.1 hypothetical protein [Gelidibacter salicanalis]
MKAILSYLSILLIVIAVTSCNVEENFQEPNIELVPVYSITNIQGPSAPFKINIYRQDDLIVEYSSSVNASNFNSDNYSDTSTEDMYILSVDKITADGSINYLITADKGTGQGTLTMNGTITYSIVISQTDVYN